VAELLAWNPSRRFGLHRKGDIAEGFDADLALLDPDETWTIRADDSFSTQGYTPFEGIEVDGRVKRTFRRGELVYADHEIVGDRSGRYLQMPYGSVEETASMAPASGAASGR
jgi:allantoinase